MLHRFFPRVFPAALTVVIVFIGALQAQDAAYIFLQTGHSGDALCLDLSPDERYLVTGSKDNTIKYGTFRPEGK